MKYLFKMSLLAFLAFSLTSCFEDRDDNGTSPTEIKNFVWTGMNAVYLYKADVPDLANDRFSNNSEYSDYLDSYASPEDLFGSLIYQPQTIDRFSLIHPDYIALEQLLVGTSISNGLRFYAFAPPSNASERILVIRQVLEGSVADNANLQRGQFINQIDGVTITADNVNTLLSQDTYTLHFANYNDNGTPETTDDTFTSNGNTSTLTKTVFTSNPVQLSSIIDVDSEKLGYLLYSAFNSNFNTELNNAFAQFQSNNIQHLVIDLRYNGGGSIDTARLLASMVTGQFNGQVFSKLFFNEDQQQSNRDYKFVNNFDGNSINSLNLNKVYVLTTSSSASASELIINSLKPYITVVQVGDYTTGKTQASTIIYDSPDLGPNNKNPNHNYAMLPLIANSANVNDELVPSNGLMPDILLEEDVLNLNILGNTNEPLLSAVIDDILGIGRPQNAMETPSVSIKKDIKTNPIESLMFIDYLDSEH